MKEEAVYLEAHKQFKALEKALETAHGRASEVTQRIAEEQAKLDALTERKREAAMAYAGGSSPVALNKAQGEMTQQQGLLAGLQETLAMVEEVVAEKKHTLAVAEQTLLEAHTLYWMAESERLAGEDFETAKRVIMTAYRAQCAAGQRVPFYDFASQFFDSVPKEEAYNFNLEAGKVPERFPQSHLLKIEDRKNVQP